MRYSRCFIITFVLILVYPGARAGEVVSSNVHPQHDASEQVRRNYKNTSRYLIPGHAISIVGSPSQVMRISRWLDEIYQIPVGRSTLQKILDSGNNLSIRHTAWALHASGRTLAPVSRNLTNGLGENVEIMFDARIPEAGSHAVFDASYNSIEFTAIQNLFHELVHARHLSRGTWRYFDSEGQAIEEENIFRHQHSELHGLAPASLRAAVAGEQIWWPDH